MPEVYRSAPVESQGESSILVVHCSDPRYQPHFQDFLRNGLGLRRYGLIAVPGGVHFLTLVEYLPKFFWAGWRWMKFMMDLSKPSTVILIAHDDCRWYHEPRFGHDPARIHERQIADLNRARQEVVERFGSCRVELYFARLEGDRVVFRSL